MHKKFVACGYLRIFFKFLFNCRYHTFIQYSEKKLCYKNKINKIAIISLHYNNNNNFLSNKNRHASMHRLTNVRIAASALKIPGPFTFQFVLHKDTHQITTWEEKKKRFKNVLLIESIKSDCHYTQLWNYYVFMKFLLFTSRHFLNLWENSFFFFMW